MKVDTMHHPNATTRRGSLNRRKLKIRHAFFALLGLWLYGFFWFAHETRSYVPLLQDEALDAIVVLTGGTNRIATGFDLLEQKQAGKLFISGVYQGVEVSELLKSWKSTSEDLSCCITLGYEADNTRENAQEVAGWVAKENISSIYLVTSNYHMKRALLELAGQAPGVTVSPYPVTPLDADLDNWWQSLDTALLMTREYGKYSLAFLRHYLLP